MMHNNQEIPAKIVMKAKTITLAVFKLKTKHVKNSK